MAKPIKSIPELTGEEANKFLEKMIKIEKTQNQICANCGHNTPHSFETDKGKMCNHYSCECKEFKQKEVGE